MCKFWHCQTTTPAKLASLNIWERLIKGVEVIQIRREQPEDAAEIGRLTKAAFSSMPFSDGREPAIIENLRQSGDLTLSLVAVEGGKLLGHIAFSPINIANIDSNWFGLGPVSVWPARQRQGIGSALINDGLHKLRDMDAGGCVLIGDPGYYKRFGFVSDGSLDYEGVPGRYVQYLCLGGQHPRGRVRFSPAFQ